MKPLQKAFLSIFLSSCSKKNHCPSVITGTRITISDKYAICQWQTRRKYQKGNIELHTAFFQNHNFIWSLPRNNGHRPSKCQELNNFTYLHTFATDFYFLSCFQIFLDLIWPNERDPCPEVNMTVMIIIRWVTVCTKWQFRTEYNLGGKLQTPCWLPGRELVRLVKSGQEMFENSIKSKNQKQRHVNM